MCGIAGYIGKPDQKVIERMTRLMVHRGPDDEGYFVNGEVALGMRRLKIIDLEGGKQPMRSDRSVVVFNGEIYNFKSLRSELEKLGLKFKTNSDTEVILQGYEKWGVKIFDRLDGMFGLAIWDDIEKKLILARDRFGEKPLYYGEFEGIFIFGSELKSLLAHPAVKKEINPEALTKYLTFDYVPAPLSIFKNIFKLEPGCYLEYSIKEDKTPSSSPFSRGRITRYWNTQFSENQISLGDAKERMERHLEQAVTSRMVSDVPLGVFLSGGLDSSSIAYFAQKNSRKKIKTFSIGFKDKSFDESSYARVVANYLGTEHTEHIFSSQDTQSVIPEIFEKLDEPFSDASILPTCLLSKFTREKVTVALDGDGSDELFGGYPTMQVRKLMRLVDLIPKFLIDGIPASFDNITFEYGLKRMVLSRRYPSLLRDFIWIGSFAPHEVGKLLNKNFNVTEGFSLPSFRDDHGGLEASATLNSSFNIIEKYLSEASYSSDFNKIIYLYLKLYLQDNILTKSDRASMMVSLETRAPFLSKNLAEFINSLPVEYKMRGLTTKYLLKQVMQKYLPHEIVYRKKKGFGIPMARWLTSDLKPLLQELLNRDRIRKEGYFDPDFVQDLIDQHMAQRKDNRKPLWTLMAFQMWKERWF